MELIGSHTGNTNESSGKNILGHMVEMWGKVLPWSSNVTLVIDADPQRVQRTTLVPRKGSCSGDVPVDCIPVKLDSIRDVHLNKRAFIVLLLIIRTTGRRSLVLCMGTHDDEYY
ncbi:hypothetical protein CHARACLAT_029635 [Characodon lateralis]|uniref:Uncharacterized protein n=1 Tax=Characodon lateralis TaxID=208331 RepID=A0ABU7F933_9TELE|nr:hypothetical protein [Characodon lateralis]